MPSLSLATKRRALDATASARWWQMGTPTFPAASAAPRHHRDSAYRKTVFVVDDSVEQRVALSRLLDSAGYHVCPFDTVERFLAEQDPEIPGCLLLDANARATHRVELQRYLSGSMFGRPVVFLSGHADVSFCVNVMKAGAVDFLTEPVDEGQLYAAIDGALRRDAEERRRRAINHTIEKRFEELTPRERQVLVQVVFGRLNKQIAAELGTGEKCIKVHRSRVMMKMGARSVAELVQLAARIGVAMDLTQRLSDSMPHLLRPEYRA
jgi:FixJ family two-component response regulator